MDNDSPIIDDTINSLNDKDTAKESPLLYTMMLSVCVVVIILFLIYHSYSCFCNNRESDVGESYINEQPRTDIQTDNSFDVDSEVKKLVQFQERHLEKLQRSRM